MRIQYAFYQTQWLVFDNFLSVLNKFGLETNTYFLDFIIMRISDNITTTRSNPLYTISNHQLIAMNSMLPKIQMKRNQLLKIWIIIEEDTRKSKTG